MHTISLWLSRKATKPVMGQGCCSLVDNSNASPLRRAILKNAPIPVTRRSHVIARFRIEQQIQNALAKLLPGRTVIAIAHRLSTILSADQIIVMDCGPDQGDRTHAELLEKSGYYRRLYDHQFNRIQEEPPAEAGILVEELVSDSESNGHSLSPCRLISTCTPLFFFRRRYFQSGRLDCGRARQRFERHRHHRSHTCDAVNYLLQNGLMRLDGCQSMISSCSRESR